MENNGEWKVIVLMGVPGSGKGTQAQLLAHNSQYVHISTGQLFRNIDADPFADREDKEVVHHINSGHLVPDYLVYKIAFHAIGEVLKQGKVPVLDGAIRNLEQAKQYENFFEENNIADSVAIVEIAIDDELSFKRLTTRKVCSSCQYIIPYSPDNFKKEICEKCGGALKVRTDDHPETALRRIESQGNALLRPIIDYYRSVGHVFTVDGSQSIPEVDRAVRKMLNI